VPKATSGGAAISSPGDARRSGGVVLATSADSATCRASAATASAVYVFFAACRKSSKLCDFLGPRQKKIRKAKGRKYIHAVLVSVNGPIMDLFADFFFAEPP
jgi:hypothetical protein